MLVRQKHYSALSDDALRSMAPSIFTSGSAETTSDRYTHISTFDVIQGLRGEGYEPVQAVQCRTRKANKEAYTKHMIRFRHTDAMSQDGLYSELVLINSHDGLSSYRLMAGLFRLICSNGLIAGETYDEVKVRHQGDVVGNVIEGTYRVMDSGAKMIEHSAHMGGIILTRDEKQAFAETVHELRFDGDDSPVKEAITPDLFLRPRRYQESGKDDLFTVFNIAQENVIKGGLTGWSRTPEGRFKRSTTREIKSIDQSTALNRALWSLAEKMSQLKQAA